MKFRVADKAAFRVVGISCPLDKELNKNFENRAWRQVNSAQHFYEKNGLVRKGIQGAFNWRMTEAVRRKT